MNRIIEDIGEFIFVNDPLETSDCIFIPGGSWPEPSERAAELWRGGFAPLILPSGNSSPKRDYRFPGAQTKSDIYGGTYATEWEFMRDVLLRGGVDDSAILKEDRAGTRGTYDNAFYSREVTDSMGLTIRRGIIVCKAFHARRCLMTYQWAFPQTRFLICGVDIDGLSRDNWHTTPKGIDRVMSELQKCGKYFAEAMPAFLIAGV